MNYTVKKDKYSKLYFIYEDGELITQCDKMELRAFKDAIADIQAEEAHEELFGGEDDCEGCKI